MTPPEGRGIDPAPRQGQSAFKFELNLSYRVKEVVAQESAGKPSLIFCNSRKSTVSTAGQLGGLGDGAQLAQRRAEAAGLAEPRLRALVADHGVGFHHAGLSMADRRLVESMFVAASCRPSPAPAPSPWGSTCPLTSWSSRAPSSTRAAS
jgi:hypothetical protein